MATIPEGYVELDLVGFTDKGDYNSGVTYVKNDLVHNNNKIYLSLQDDNTGNALPSSTETENTYWKVWLAGSADDLANITVKDTSNVTGSGSNSIVVAQTLIDAIASKVMNDLVAKSQIVNNLTTSTTGSVLDASRGKNLQDQITQLNSKLAPVKRNLTWQSTVSEIGASYSLKFGNWVYVHAGFTTVSGLSAGNDLTMLIGSGAMQTINNIAAISDKGEIGVFRVNETNLQADGTIPSGHAFILDLVIPLQS